MTEIGQAQAYRLFEPESVVRGLANYVCHNFKETYVARLQLSCCHKRELQCLIRKLGVPRVIMCQESLECFPRGEIINQTGTEVDGTYLPLFRIDSSMEASTERMRSSISFGVRTFEYSGSPSVGDPEDGSG